MKSKTGISLLLAGFVVCGMLSCTKMDEYKKISGDKEIVYPGKITEVTVRSGDGRLVVAGLCNSDPKIVSCRIYWNLKAEYVDIPVDMSAGRFVVEKQIALSEGSYNFDIYTYDAQGNQSIPVNAMGKTYGELYKASITNRLVKSFTEQGGQAVIEWWGMDATLGAYQTEVTYTNTQSVAVKLQVPLDEQRTTLEDYDKTSEVQYVTLYKPDATCVDIFRSGSDKATLE